jgi:hypothetical protein
MDAGRPFCFFQMRGIEGGSTRRMEEECSYGPSYVGGIGRRTVVQGFSPGKKHRPYLKNN